MKKLNHIFIVLLTLIALQLQAQQAKQNGMPINFTLSKPGFVTLVIDNAEGVRVRNLLAESWFPAGKNTAWWDGADDLGRDVDAAKHGLYHVPGQMVAPGTYKVRGLVRDSIIARYEFSTYFSGTPPWRVADHTGAWMANHTPPQAAVSVPGSLSPTGQPVVLLGAYVTEGPDGLIWVDADGIKRGGKAWIGGNWTAAPFLAADRGENAVPRVAAYVASTWETDKNSGKAELRLNSLMPNTKNDYSVKEVLRYNLGAVPRVAMTEQIGGMAVHNGTVVISMVKRNQLLVIDCRTGKLTDSISVNAPQGLAFDASGRLLTLSGNTLLRYAAIGGKVEKLIVGKLDAPYGVLTDAQNNIYISNRGKHHQVLVFDSKGKYLRAVGKANVPSTGKYYPDEMHYPAGMALDATGKLWVTEQDYLPKRVSVWDNTGKLVRAFYGPPKYGGGGKLDGGQPNRFYYAEEDHGAMRFELDWQTGTSKVAEIYYRPDSAALKLAFRNNGPETPLYHNGKRYFTNCFNNSPTGGSPVVFLFQERNGVAYPVAGMGRAGDWARLAEKDIDSRWPKGRKNAFFIWQDENADALVQAAEVQMYPTQTPSGGITIQNDLAFTVARLDGRAVQFKPTKFTPAGVPQYNYVSGIKLTEELYQPASSGGDQVLPVADGYAIATLGAKPFLQHSFSGIKNGKAVWSYPNLWPGLHASHSAPLPDRPGILIGPTRLLGDVMKFKLPEVPALWAVNGNHGNVYLFTDDGIFIATLFKAMRAGKSWRMPEWKRDMRLDSITLGEENFWPSITKTNEDKVYLVDGARSSLIRLDGINTIRRLPELNLQVTTEALVKAKKAVVEEAEKQHLEAGVKTLDIKLSAVAPAVDGQLNDWNASAWATIDQRGIKAYFNATTKPYNVAAAIAITGNNLYAAFKTGDPKLLVNTGEMPQGAFKTGGALDIMLGAANGNDDRRQPVAGDMRLLVTEIDGKPRAWVYRAVVPGTKAGAKVNFSSPVQTISFDQVVDVTNDLRFAKKEGDYEFSIPLSVLGLKPQVGQQIKGDVGILRGAGGQTVDRVYWNNKATAMVSDVPTEAELKPAMWGKFKFITP